MMTEIQPTPILTLPADQPTVNTPTALVLTPTATVTWSTTATISPSVAAVAGEEALTPFASERIITYTVKPGDHLTKIAQAYGTTAQQIQTLNRLTSDVIHPGDVLRIPATIIPTPSTTDNAALALMATLTAAAQPILTIQPTGVHPPSEQLAAGEASGATRQAVWRLLNWGRENGPWLTLAITLLIALLASLVGFFLYWHGPPVRRPPPQQPSVTMDGLSSPPAAGTAYLETRLGTTGVTLYYPLAQPITIIGRDPGNSIVIDQYFADPNTVSRQHVQIVRTGDRFVAKDLSSANGLLIDQRRSRENVLRDGVILGIGKTQFIFRHNQSGGAV
ncbi:MAG: LysM peptidoglycan-binding domain-containing protein [Caldilineaceae bacterium]|nr:LysM peptidoglycan-binding domain-containing protein [Caldilineaceae bacterium]